MPTLDSDRLAEWAEGSNTPPLMLLYGEANSGKTALCQQLVHNLRQAAQPRWKPHYFQLRYASFATPGPVPTLPEILTEVVRRHWMPGDVTLPTGEQLLADARREPTLFVVEDFEWLRNQWPELWQQRVLMHELLKLVPTQSAAGTWSGPFAGAQAKVVLSLRTMDVYNDLLHQPPFGQLSPRHRYTDVKLVRPLDDSGRS